MIPVMGLPILNKPELLYRTLDSVDHAVDRLYIVDNGNVVDPARVRGANAVHICDPGYNMGVGPAWNLIVQANIDAPWWLITSNDLVFSPGALGRLVKDMEINLGTPHLSRIVIGNQSWGNHFGAFAFTPEAIDLIGWFDPNIYPIHYEDTDWIARIERAKPLGFTVSDIVSTTHHDDSASWKDVPANARAKLRTWDLNRDYYDAKWGMLDKAGPYDMPFMHGRDLGYNPRTTVARLRSQDWHVERKT